MQHPPQGLHWIAAGGLCTGARACQGDDGAETECTPRGPGRLRYVWIRREEGGHEQKEMGMKTGLNGWKSTCRKFARSSSFLGDSVSRFHRHHHHLIQLPPSLSSFPLYLSHSLRGAQGSMCSDGRNGGGCGGGNSCSAKYHW